MALSFGSMSGEYKLDLKNFIINTHQGYSIPIQLCKKKDSLLPSFCTSPDKKVVTPLGKIVEILAYIIRKFT